MDLGPLVTAVPPVPSHAFVAMAAILLGALQFLLPKGTASHRVLGWAWVLALAYVAASGLFIYDLRVIGPISPIHLLSLITLVMLWRAVRAARAGRTAAHGRAMTTLFALALIVTGFFTLWPGRTMHAVIFGG